MWRTDWIDTLVILGWVGLWSALVYFLPLTGI